jgi:hypothetical protein
MNDHPYIILAIVSSLTFWAGYRLAKWQSKRGLDVAIERALASGGLRMSEEFTALLRRPTVDGVARRTLKKMGMANYMDVNLLGLTVTIVGHSKSHLNHVAAALHALRKEIEDRMRLESFKAQMKEQEAKTPAPAAEAGLRVLDGGKS